MIIMIIVVIIINMSIIIIIIMSIIIMMIISSIISIIIIIVEHYFYITNYKIQYYFTIPKVFQRNHANTQIPKSSKETNQINLHILLKILQYFFVIL